MSNYDPERMVPLLQSVALELTNHCQLGCSICWSQNPSLHPPREKGFMDRGLFKSIIDQLVEYRKDAHKRIFLSMGYGGESLMHPYFDELLVYAASKRSFKIQLITNGLDLRDHIDVLLRHRVLVTISYHHVPLGLKKQVDDAIMLLLSRRGTNRVNIAVVDAEHPGLYREARDKFGGMVYNYPLISEDLKYLEGERKGEPYCKSPFHYMGILWNGDVWPCCHLLSSDFPSLGNLNNGTINEIWDGELYRSLRLDPDAFPCKECQLW